MRQEERTFVAIKPDGVQRGLVGEVIKRFKYAIQPCVFEINGTYPDKMYLFYRTLRHAQDENSSCGGGTIPEKYWGDEVTIFFEEDVTIYLDESEVCE